jgi:hypothetical protein
MDKLLPKLTTRGLRRVSPVCVMDFLAECDDAERQQCLNRWA